MQKKIFILFMFVVILCNGWSQTMLPKQEFKPSKNIIYTEFGGNSLIYSINYERIIFAKPKFQFSVRAGFGSFPIIVEFKDTYVGWPPPDHYLTSNISIPVEMLFSFGSKSSKFELGIGYTNLISMRTLEGPYNSDRIVTNYMIGIAPSFSYRYEKPEGGFFLKAGITPMVLFNTNPTYSTMVFNYPIPMPKLCIGYKFKTLNRITNK